MRMARCARRWTLWAGLALIGYGLLFTLWAVFQPFGEAVRPFIGDLGRLLANLVAASLMLWAAARSADRCLRGAWLLIGLGFLAWAGGDLVWSWCELVQGILPVSPHAADLLYLLFYPLVFLGLLIYPTGRQDRAGTLKLLLDVSAIVAGAGAFGWYYLIAPVVARAGVDVLRLTVEIAYPVADLVLLWALLRACFAWPQRVPRPALLMLLTSIAVSLVADVMYIGLSQQGLYESGRFLDALWVLASVTAGGAALAHHRELSLGIPAASGDEAVYLRRPFRPVQQFLPYLALEAAFLLMLKGVGGAALDLRRWGLVAGLAAVTLFIVMRQLVTIQEHHRLNEALWRLSNELERRVAERTIELDRRVAEITSLHEQVQRANEQLRELDRLKSEFLASVSHELRTPLTSIIGYTELMLHSGDGTLSRSQAENLEVILANSQRLLKLVNELLDVTRMEAGKFRVELVPMPLEVFLHQLVAEARPQAEKRGLTLYETIPAELPLVLADGQRIGQVVNNLLSNAFKFTPPGGSVTLEALELVVGAEAGSREPGWVGQVVAQLPAGRWVVVAVHDTGIGIPASEMPHLFTRFYRGEGSRRHAVQGTGLGLYVARTIVEAHHGHIGVASQPGQGSTFWFALPTYEA